MDWTKDWQAKLKLNGLSPAQIEQVRVEIVEKLIADIPFEKILFETAPFHDPTALKMCKKADKALKQQLRDKWL